MRDRSRDRAPASDLRLRLPLVCLGAASVAIAHHGLDLVARGALGLSPGEIGRLSLPLTVAWFAFAGSCLLTRAEEGALGRLVAAIRAVGHAALIAGVPIWSGWYLHLVFRVV